MEVDPRFKGCFKEYVIAQIFGIGTFVIAMIAAYALGAGDPAGYTYLFGFPAWFAVGSIIIIVGLVLMCVWIMKGYKLYKLDPRADAEEVK